MYIKGSPNAIYVWSIQTGNVLEVLLPSHAVLVLRGISGVSWRCLNLLFIEGASPRPPPPKEIYKEIFPAMGLPN